VGKWRTETVEFSVFGWRYSGLAMMAVCYVVFDGDGFLDLQHKDILCLRTWFIVVKYFFV
jgi:hypothetical protein